MLFASSVLWRRCLHIPAGNSTTAPLTEHLRSVLTRGRDASNARKAKKEGLLGRLGEQRRELARVLSQYGRVGVCVYTGLSLTSLGASLLAVKTGIGLDSSTTASPSLGLLEELTLAYVLHKTTLPVRIPLTVALTPAASRKIKTLSLLVQRRFGF